jgi:hypothetical protein
VRAAVLTGDGGDGGAPIEFAEGKTVAGAPTGPEASTGGGGSSWTRWSEVGQLGVDEIEGEEGGGPAASRAASGERLGAAPKMEEGEWGGGSGAAHAWQPQEWGALGAGVRPATPNWSRRVPAARRCSVLCVSSAEGKR